MGRALLSFLCLLSLGFANLSSAVCGFVAPEVLPGCEEPMDELPATSVTTRHTGCGPLQCPLAPATMIVFGPVLTSPLPDHDEHLDQPATMPRSVDLPPLTPPPQA